jgi:hypothetical protein
VTAAAAVDTTNVSVSYEATEPGPGASRKRRFAWGFSRKAWWHDGQKCVDKVSTFLKPHSGDRRLETITDPDTGEVIHHCDHKLSEHRGHRSDKRRRA